MAGEGALEADRGGGVAGVALGADEGVAVDVVSEVRGEALGVGERGVDTGASVGIVRLPLLGIVGVDVGFRRRVVSVGCAVGDVEAGGLTGVVLTEGAGGVEDVLPGCVEVGIGGGVAG